jgi:hypothetical protein
MPNTPHSSFDRTLPIRDHSHEPGHPASHRTWAKSKSYAQYSYQPLIAATQLKDGMVFELISQPKPGLQELCMVTYKNGELYNDAGQPLSTSADKHGYRQIRVKPYRGKWLHRVIWELHHGMIPPNHVIDHIDRDPTNNQIENLRCVTQVENVHNSRAKPNKFGRGVMKDKDGRYCARIQVNGKRVSKVFKDVKDAQSCYNLLAWNLIGPLACFNDHDEALVWAD